MPNKIEIILKTANNQPVSLKSMTPEALDSFLAVVSSLKSIATSIGSNTVFTISEGSASCAVYAPDNEVEVDNMYNGIELAIKGKSRDKNFTTNTKTIQDQLKRTGYDYRFIYTNDKYETHKVIQIHERLREAKKITLKRTKSEFEYKLRVVSGFLNQIGGNTPNYHFDYGHGNKITISCTKEEAIDIKKYLYQDIFVILFCKEWTSDKKSEYYHKQILDKEKVSVFKEFFQAYYIKEDIVDRLEYLHEFIYENIKNNINGIDILSILLNVFNTDNLHLSELKTLLVISKPFKNNSIIERERMLLVETYENIRNKK